MENDIHFLYHLAASLFLDLFSNPLKYLDESTVRFFCSRFFERPFVLKTLITVSPYSYYISQDRKKVYPLLVESPRKVRYGKCPPPGISHALIEVTVSSRSSHLHTCFIIIFFILAHTVFHFLECSTLKFIKLNLT